MVSEKRECLAVIVSAALLVSAYYLLFEPVWLTGDSPAYMRYGELIREGGDSSAYIHRSPLYPWLIAPLTYFAEPVAASLAVALNYILLFLAVPFLHAIASRLFVWRWQRLLAVALLLFNLPVIYFGYMVLTETLTLLLLFVTLWLLIRHSEQGSPVTVLLAGISFSLMVLARFNTLPLLAVIILFIVIDNWFTRRRPHRSIIYTLLLFLLPPLLILNGYATYNRVEHDFYGLFPTGGSILVSRNALISTIDGSEALSENNRAVYEIFSNAAEEFHKSRDSGGLKGSMSAIDRYNITTRLYSGFPIYLAAVEPLCIHFGIERERSGPELSRVLRPFYAELAKEKRGELWELRLLSLASSFRSSSGLVTGSNPPVNLDRLPAAFIIFHKLLMFTVKAGVAIALLINIVAMFAGKAGYNRVVMAFAMLYIGFLFINFSLALVNDSNRYTFPVEALTTVFALWYIISAVRVYRERAGLIEQRSTLIDIFKA